MRSRPRTRLSILAALAAAAVASAPAGESRAALVGETRAALAAAEEAVAAGDDELARAQLERALDRAAALGPTNLLTARAHDGLGDLHRRARRLERAAEHYHAALAQWERLLGADQPRLAVTALNLGVVLCELERHGEALPLLGRAVRLFEANPGPDSPEAEAARGAYRRAGRSASMR